MTITFADIPTTLRVPFVGVEFDPSRARTGPAIKVFRALLIGHRTSAGTVAELVQKRITGADQAATWFGKGSMLHHMAEAWFTQNQLVETYAIAQDATGTAAVHRLAWTGPASAAGTISLWIGGRLVKVAIASGRTAIQIASDVVAAINADTTLLVTAAVGSTTTWSDLTFRHGGTSGNFLDVRVNFASDEALPAGVSVVITTPTAGATDPDLADVFPAIGDQQFDIIVPGFHDSTGRTALATELDARWQGDAHNDGRAILGAAGTHGELTTLGNTLNAKHLVIIGANESPTPPWEWAAALGSVAARELQADPALQLKTLELRGVLAPAETDRFTLAEQNLLLYDGIATWTADQAGTVRLGRVITTYQLGTTGQPDPTFLDLTTLTTLSYLKFDTVARFGPYARHKLAPDGTNFGAGQKVMTPSLGKAVFVNAFQDWEQLGLVTNFDQFRDDLVAEINTQDPNRLDLLLSPNLINSLIVAGVRMAFIL